MPWRFGGDAAWQAAGVAIALDQMLQRVVADVFENEVVATYPTEPKSPTAAR